MRCCDPEVNDDALWELTHGGQQFVVQWRSSSQLALSSDATHYGFVLDGHLQLRSESGEFQLRSQMYFAVPGSGELNFTGRLWLITQRGGRGLFHLGGPIESTGRLRYIDGCTDTLLIPPVMCGDPCLNLLCIPPAVKQSQHTHPSFRSGVIASGHGTCHTPQRDYSLAPGSLFCIPADEQHSFHTDRETLRVIAFHPDSDMGPTHENHPMINRTFLRSDGTRQRSS